MDVSSGQYFELSGLGDQICQPSSEFESKDPCSASDH